jgi:tetratricopeptide (TPR) repeat protein
MPDKMLPLALQLESSGEMKFTDYWKIIEYGVKAEDWGVVQQYCGKARPLASRDAYRQEWSEYEFTDEQADKAAENRKAMLAIKNGWAKANTGLVDESLEDFVLANDNIRRSYLDIPEYDLNLYWGSALVMKGDYEQAIRLFAPEALIMDREEAVEGLQEAYAGMNGSETGYETYAARLHQDIAKTVDDFNLPDYDGQMRNFAELRGEVTLLAFWFPT